MPDNAPSYKRLFAEMKRRRVFRVMAVYGALAFAVIEASDVVLPRMALPDWTVTLVVWLALLGFPVAIALAWAFDVTPGGLERTSDAAPGELTRILSAPASKRWPAGLLALVGVVAMVTGAWYVGRRSTQADASAATTTAVSPDAESDAEGADPAPVSESIAVLPFVNMSSDPEQEYFSDGISEEVLNLLARIPELRVTSRSSAFSFKGQDLEIPEIAGRLRVAHVLEGSVRKSGDQVRITAQLIDARTDTHVWSQTWDRTLDDIFTIQDEIARAVVKQLKIKLLDDVPKLEQTSPEAYALYLQAREVGYQYNRTGLEQSNDLYRQSLAIDPDFAPAWSGLGTNFFWAGYFGRLQYDEAFALALEATNKSLALNPDSASAHALLGGIALLYEGDHREAAKHYQHALKLDPSNSENLSMAALQLERLGRMKETIALREYLVTNDPANSRSHFYLGISYLRGGQPNNAIASFQTVLALEPSYVSAHFRIGVALLFKDEAEAALTEMKLEPTEAYRWFGLTMAYYATGQQEESDATLTRLVEKYEQKSAYNIAYVYAFRDEADKAFEWLEKAILFRDSGLSSVSTQGLFLNIHNDPRWLPFLESIGQSPEQLAAIEFEVNLPE